MQVTRAMLEYVSHLRLLGRILILLHNSCERNERGSIISWLVYLELEGFEPVISA